jgi:hypothetical protein
MPELSSDTLPAGFHDGWYRDPSDTIHVLTFHATYFGILESAAAAKSEFAVAFSYPHTLDVRKQKKLTVTLTSTLPGKLALVLRKGSHVVAKTMIAVTAKKTTATLVLPAHLAKGICRLTAVLTAGKERNARVVDVKVSGG